MSTIIVHGVPGSPYVRTPLLACEEKGVPWRLTAMGMGEAQTPAHLARHPFGRVPTMEHGGFALYESQAMIRYIDQAFDGPRLVPDDPRAAARMNQVMGIVDWYVFPSMSRGISWNRIVAPMFDLPVDEAAVAAAVPMARTCVAALEEIIDDKPFFAGEAISLADLMVLPHLDFLPTSPPEGPQLLKGSPLLGWLERMEARPSARRTSMQVLRASLEPQPA